MSKKNRQLAAQAAASARNRNEIWAAAGLTAVLFAAVVFSVTDTIKIVAMAAMIFTVGVMLLQGKVLRERLSWLTLAVTCWVIMNGISTLYAVSGKFALYEFLKLAISFGIFVGILACGRGTGRSLGRRSATALECCSALVSVFSIDLISTRILSSAFFWFVGLFSQSYEGLSGIEVGVRMTSVFQNPNIFAGCVGIGVLLSLGLATTAESGRERSVHLVCLALNALAFLLAFSMGASGTIAVAFLAYLLLERPERRASVLMVMVETLVVCMAAAFPIYLTAFDQWDGVQPVPVLCAAAAAVVLCLSDRFVGRRVSRRLEGKEKVVFALIALVLAAVAVYGVLAYNVAGAASLEAGETLRRSAYPEPGAYTLEVEGSGELTVVIETQNRQDTMMHTSTVLYKGAAQGAEFTVPEDSMVVYFNFTAPDGAQFQSAAYQGEGGTGSLRLGYKLIPGFVADRLQGLFANQNAIQRTVFFEDGMKLFSRSPVVGLGLGAFESGQAGVQSFYYESKYVHNHYIQSLVDTGVVGLALFVSVLLLSAVAVIRARRREEFSPLTACLGAALVFMALHGTVEVVFSSNFYLPFALGAFGLIDLCCGGALMALPGGKKHRVWYTWTGALFTLAYILLLSGNLYARSLFVLPTYENLELAVTVDRFEWTDYMTSYALSASQEEEPDPVVKGNMEYYLKRLERVESNIVPYYLAQCYFNLGRTEEAFAMLERYLNYTSSNAQSWQSAFLLAMQHGESAQEYKESVAHLYKMFREWNEANMGSVTLDPTILAFLQYNAGEIGID